MTQSAFTPTNAHRAPADGVASKVGRAFRGAAAAIGKAIVVLVAYRAALKRLEAGVEGNLFDQPVLWAEIKSVAWDEAAVAAERWKDRLPSRAAWR